MANENCLESYPFYVSDWRGSKAVSAMTAAEQGLYRNLLDICWQTGSLPINKNALQRLSFVSEAEFKKSWPAVSKMFVEKDGELHNEKVDERRPAVLRAKAARSRGAQVVNAKRWENGIAQRLSQRTLSVRPLLLLLLLLSFYQQKTLVETHYRTVRVFHQQPRKPRRAVVCLPSLWQWPVTPSRNDWRASGSARLWRRAPLSARPT